VDLNAPATQPVYNPISQLVYAAGRDQVSDVWVAGEQLLDNGKLTTVNENELLELAAAWQERIAHKH